MEKLCNLCGCMHNEKEKHIHSITFEFNFLKLYHKLPRLHDIEELCKKKNELY